MKGDIPTCAKCGVALERVNGRLAFACEHGGNTVSKKLYCVIFEAQQKQIEEWCWGSCGHGIVGAVDLGPATAVACAQTECPHLDRQMDESLGDDLYGNALHLRKLQEVAP